MTTSRASGVDMGGTWTPATAAAAAISGVISAVPCTGRKVLAANSDAATTYYLFLFDLPVVPLIGALGRLPAMPIGPNQGIEFDLDGLVCANGLCWGASSTVDTYTPIVALVFQVSVSLR